MFVVFLVFLVGFSILTALCMLKLMDGPWVVLRRWSEQSWIEKFRVCESEIGDEEK